MSSSPFRQEVTKTVIKLKPPKGPPGRRPIGYRGQHIHGKPLNDPVYPTTKVPCALVPRFPNDWRNGGRALLTIGMARLEGKRLNRHQYCLKWQKEGVCGPRCGSGCGTSQYRCLCAWRVAPVPKYHHITQMDGMLMEFKRHMPTKKPVFSMPKRVAKRPRYRSEAMSWDPSAGRYVYTDRQPIHPAFNLMPNRDDTRYDEGESDVDSEDELPDDSGDEESDDDGHVGQLEGGRGVSGLIEGRESRHRHENDEAARLVS
ncbi:unnamed protein product [Vitrella brassicaformis CCMP3155]|uniref:Uncharacterized protein n=1 Tax=Vitrella brassicaformis (strain CCMP3155) TaxID=1169540 RepID=A0A0G4GIT3_VITBC|nr:unnamed protein product [Vitrella brassicaformis CCMP3155]|eukprot:CEM29610.1 unnamed protein product [Vitrella brassicaformis CCMP3155]